MGPAGTADSIPMKWDWDTTLEDTAPSIYNTARPYTNLTEAPTWSPSAMSLSQRAREYTCATAANKARLRKAIGACILASDSSEGTRYSPESILSSALDAILRSRSDSRLDDAIDMLTEVAPITEQYALHELADLDAQRFEQKYWDDYYYVLFRALGRTQRLPGVLTSFEPSKGHMGLREAVVVALGDLAEESIDPTARAAIERFAKEDKSRFIRQLAEQVLQELDDQ